MEPWVIAVIVKPLVLFILMVCIVLPIKLAFIRFFPEGRIKRFLLIRTN